MKKRALIAMSGGVDSSVAAYLMKKQGYECIGATMKLYGGIDVAKCNKKTCCSLNDMCDARAVCDKIGMEHHIFDFKDDFDEKVIRKFISCYENGITPNPCIDCNRYLKFEALYAKAKELGCTVIATGHYADIEYEDGRYFLKKAADKRKDQSYVLYSLTQEQLAHTVFPCGKMTKTDIRKIAAEQGFINADKHESQDICFVPNGDYTGFIEKHTGRSYPKGDFVDRNGNVLGQHKGIIHYTIGQRKGLGISNDMPLYVCRINAGDNTIVLGSYKELFSHELDAADLRWSAISPATGTFRAMVKIRYRHTEEPATITPTGNGNVHIVFDEPQRAITKGQAAVFYDGDIVIGGGVIV